MNHTLLALCTVILLCLVTTAHAADITAASCSNADVQTAINRAANGDRVLIPSGRCTWTSQVTIPSTKGITLQGAGIGTTTLVNGTGNGSGALVVNVASGHALTRITNFTWDGNSVNYGGEGATFFITGTGLNVFRVDHLYMVGLTGNVIDVHTAGNGSALLSGVIDHNYLQCIVGASCHGTQVSGAYGANTSAEGGFALPIALGTNQMVYVENNTFDYLDWNDDVGESINGARWVYRYNTIKNVSAGWHGADSGYLRGIHSFEMYRNTFTTALAAGRYALNSRSGTGVLFDNSWNHTNADYTFANLQLYRVTAAWVIGTRDLPCAGAETWDGNLGSGANAGWPCLDQAGWIFGVGAGNGDNPTFTSVPLYWWSNTHNGSRYGPSPGLPAMAPYLVADRDYFAEGASFNGTSGTGVGTLANRPATCTGPVMYGSTPVGGVGYWATDQGSWNTSGDGLGSGVLYRCTATNTWTLYYTPYTYPHPGQSNTTPPAAPTGLTVN